MERQASRSPFDIARNSKILRRKLDKVEIENRFQDIPSYIALTPKKKFALLYSCVMKLGNNFWSKPHRPRQNPIFKYSQTIVVLSIRAQDTGDPSKTSLNRNENRSRKLGFRMSESKRLMLPQHTTEVNGKEPIRFLHFDLKDGLNLFELIDYFFEYWIHQSENNLILLSGHGNEAGQFVVNKYGEQDLIDNYQSAINRLRVEFGRKLVGFKEVHRGNVASGNNIDIHSNEDENNNNNNCIRLEKGGIYPVNIDTIFSRFQSRDLRNELDKACGGCFDLYNIEEFIFENVYTHEQCVLDKTSLIKKSLLTSYESENNTIRTDTILKRLDQLAMKSTPAGQEVGRKHNLEVAPLYCYNHVYDYQPQSFKFTPTTSARSPETNHWSNDRKEFSVHIDANYMLMSKFESYHRAMWTEKEEEALE